MGHREVEQVLDRGQIRPDRAQGVDGGTIVHLTVRRGGGARPGEHSGKTGERPVPGCGGDQGRMPGRERLGFEGVSVSFEAPPHHRAVQLPGVGEVEGLRGGFGARRHVGDGRGDSIHRHDPHRGQVYSFGNPAQADARREQQQEPALAEVDPPRFPVTQDQGRPHDRGRQPAAGGRLHQPLGHPLGLGVARMGRRSTRRTVVLRERAWPGVAGEHVEGRQEGQRFAAARHGQPDGLDGPSHVGGAQGSVSVGVVDPGAVVDHCVHGIRQVVELRARQSHGSRRKVADRDPEAFGVASAPQLPCLKGAAQARHRSRAIPGTNQARHPLGPTIQQRADQVRAHQAGGPGEEHGARGPHRAGFDPVGEVLGQPHLTPQPLDDSSVRLLRRPGVHMICEAFEGGVGEEVPQRDAAGEAVLDLDHHAQGQQGMAAEVEEVVVRADAVAPQRVAPDRRDPLLGAAQRSGRTHGATAGGSGLARQRSSVHLAAGQPRQRGDADETSRDHGGREHLCHGATDGPLVRGRLHMGDQDPVLGLLAHGVHRCGDHTADALEDCLDLAHLDPLAADLNLAVAPAHERQLSVPTPADTIPGAVAKSPIDGRIRSESRGRGFWIVEISRAHAGTSEHQYALHPRRHGVARPVQDNGGHVVDGPADGHQPLANRRIGLGPGRRDRRLRGAVEVDHPRAGGLVEIPRHPRRQRLAAAEQQPEVGTPLQRPGPDQGLVETGHRLEHGDLLAPDHLAEVGDVPLSTRSRHDHLRARDQGIPDLPHGGVEPHGRLVQHPITGLGGQDPHLPAQVVGEVGVTDTRAPRTARAPRGEHDIGERVGGRGQVGTIVGARGDGVGAGVQQHGPWQVTQRGHDRFGRDQG